MTRVSNPVSGRELVGDGLADAAEPLVAVLVELPDDRRVLLARLARQPVALGDDDDREVPTLRMPFPDVVGDLLDRRRNLGDEDDVGAARDSRRGRYPARVAAHDLDDHDAVVRLGGRVQSVDRLRADVHRSVEADRHVRSGDVVVDRLRDADDWESVLRVEAARDR